MPPHETQPPRAAKKPVVRRHHGHEFIDDYEWLRQKDAPEVRAHLEAENAYATARLADQEELRQAIFTEIKERTQETDMSVPVRQGDWWYFSRTEEGKDYPLSCRVPADASGTGAWVPPSIRQSESLPGEQVMLDLNAEAEGHDFFQLGSFDVSPDGGLLAYAVDTTGDERYELRVRDLTTGQDLPDVIPDTFAGACWEPSGQYLFYSTVDEAWRPDKIWRHRLGTSPEEDIVVFHQPDERYWTGLDVTRSQRYLLIYTGSKVTSTVYVLDAADPCGPFTEVWPQREGVEYGVEHAVVDGEDRFLITHNRDRADFDVVDVDAADPRDESRWRPVLGDVTGMRIEGIDAFAGYLALSYRQDGLPRAGLIRLRAAGLYGALEPVAIEEELGSLALGTNPEFHQPAVRLLYVSMATPAVVFDLDVATGERRVLKRQQVLGDFDPSRYEQRRLWAVAADGTRIPVSLVWSPQAVGAIAAEGADDAGTAHAADALAGTAQGESARKPAAPAPLLLYGYGSYEASMDPYFSVARLSLLDRGMVYAVAHVRGGGEMGRAWYEQGRLLEKKNTFTDFIAAAEHLIAEGWTAPDRLVAQGGSAGGLLMGAVANMAPGLFAGISAEVPFVDPLTTILDPSLPLTVTEWDEWGDPLHDPHVYAYMREYTPYENIGQVAPGHEYPAILALTSLHDTRVLYVEPAKWVARLREAGADAILKVEMSAGHGGVSGRYQGWRETALEFAWLLRTAGAA
ncbi:S9 family peptidase [Sediminivirga luteola]|uniref:Oligopeptidase n=1 Tax=Sediminivirga luteola TaxID=1774748 RepID=A0A8J2XKW4_9MICO|nr:S9 family peptidase [Sediminivirga luteola]MCI2267055.1 S9 family peptidase [Sediminivirga luteola]GGA13193.1 oligopeptidase [Sediminivirga luteola]